MGVLRESSCRGQTQEVRLESNPAGQKTGEPTNGQGNGVKNNSQHENKVKPRTNRLRVRKLARKRGREKEHWIFPGVKSRRRFRKEVIRFAKES